MEWKTEIIEEFSYIFSIKISNFVKIRIIITKYLQYNLGG